MRLPRSARRFGLELVAVVLGITISFWFEDWRKGREDRAEEQRLLESFAIELKGDLEMLSVHRKRIDADVARVQAALADDSKIGDKALDAVMDTLLGYVAFDPATATYSELRQTGSSRVIRDKVLLQRVLAVYERIYPMAEEWDGINREFVLDRMFPFVDDEGPAFETKVELGYAHGYHVAWRVLREQPRFRNLLRTAVAYRQGQSAAYRMVEANVTEMLRQLKSRD